MPALDICHQQVVNALKKDGWSVSYSSKYFRIKKRLIFIDIEAHRGDNGRSQEALFAEVKCFSLEDNYTQELYGAYWTISCLPNYATGIGQFQ